MEAISKYQNGKIYTLRSQSHHSTYQCATSSAHFNMGHGSATAVQPERRRCHWHCQWQCHCGASASGQWQCHWQQWQSSVVIMMKAFRIERERPD